MEQVGLLLACLIARAVAEPPSGLYGLPGRLGVFPSVSGEDASHEPTNYEFQYEVDAEESGARFGHQEARQGEVALGQYYVLLPDGRTQQVEYVADQDGYHPTVTYLESGRESQGGYSGTGYIKVRGHDAASANLGASGQHRNPQGSTLQVGYNPGLTGYSSETPSGQAGYNR